MKSEAGWYPLALSAGLDRGTSNGTHLFGRELVVWRDNDGAAHVWEDRCPHRGMRLSLGFVRGNRIACLYHGWFYDTAGQCRYIPAHPDLTPPATIKVEVFAVAESAGMVWVWSGKAADATPLPDDPAVVPVRTIHIDGAPESVVAHLRTVALPPFGAAAGGPTTVTRSSPGFLALDNGADRVVVGVQPLDAGRTALHIAVVGGAEYERAGQKHFSAFAEDVRHALETDLERQGRSEYRVEAAE